MLVWVSACTDEVQNSRQIAATNTVILRENPDNETPESSGQLAAKGVTLKAEGVFEQEPQPFHKRTWSVVSCSRDLPENVVWGFFTERQPGWQSMHENAKVMEHYHGKTTSGLSKLRARTLSDDWIHIPVTQTKKDMKFVGKKDQWWQVWSYVEMFMSVFIKKNLCSSELHKVTQATIWKNLGFLTHRLRKATNHFCTVLGFQETKIQSNQEDLYQEVLEWAKAVDPKSRPEVQAVLPFEEPSWSNVCDWTGIGANIAWLPKQRTVVSYVTTQLWPSSSPRSFTLKMWQKGSCKHKQKKEKHYQRRKVDAIIVRRGKPQATSQKSKNQYAYETARRNLKHRRNSGRQSICEVYVQCN